MIKKLIKIGADLNSKDGENRKPADLALIKYNSNIIDILDHKINFFTCTFNNAQNYPDGFRYGMIFIFLLYIFFLEVSPQKPLIFSPQKPLK